MSLEDKKDMEKEAFSAWDSRVIASPKRKKQRVPNQELLEMTRDAERAGYGLSYGKYVQKNGL